MGPCSLPRSSSVAEATTGRRRLIWVGALGVLGVAGAVAALTMWVRSAVDEMVRTTLEERIDADVTYADLDVGWLATLPRVEVHVSDLALVGRGAFAGESLMTLDEGWLGLDLPSVLWGDAIQIRSVTLHGPHASWLVDPEGVDSIATLLHDQPESSSEPWTVELDRVDVRDGAFVLRDLSADQHLQLDGLTLHIAGTVASANTELAIDGEATSVSYAQQGLPVLSRARLLATVPVTWDPVTRGITAVGTRATINALPLSLDLTALPVPAGWSIDLKLATEATDFTSLLSVVPGAYDATFDGVHSQGTLELSASMNGVWPSEGDELPPFEGKIQVDGARFRYPDLPVGVDDITLSATLSHPQGPRDLTVLDIERLRLRAGPAPITGRLTLRHPDTDPAIDVDLEGRLDLDSLASALPDLSFPLTGVLDVDWSADGTFRAFAERSKDVRSEGTVSGTSLIYRRAGWPDLTLDDLALTFAGPDVTLDGVTVSWPESDVAMSGTLFGAIPYGFDQADLSGQLTLTSNKGLDLERFEGEPDPAADPGDSAIVVVPSDLDLRLHLDLPRVHTTELDLTDVSGDVAVAESAITLRSLRASMLGGDMQLSGTYAAPTAEQAEIDLQIEAVSLDLADTLREFDTLPRIAPLLLGAVGRFDSEGTLQARLLRDGTPEISVLTSTGVIGTRGITLQPSALTSLANKLASSELTTLTPPGGGLTYRIARGRLALQPFTAELGRVPATIRGEAGVVDRTVDFEIDLSVPTQGLAKAPWLSELSGRLPATVPVRVSIEGSYDKPKISVALADGSSVRDAVVHELTETLQPIVDEAIDDALAQARRQGDALIAAAEIQGDRLRAEASKAADTIRTQAKVNADKLVDEANNPLAKAAAKEAAKVVNNEADKAAKAVERKADRAADALVQTARSESDALIDAAANSTKGKGRR